MAKRETDITHEIMIDSSPHGPRLWKNVRGMFLTLDGARKVRAGLQAAGASDLIGFTPVLVTPDMVGSIVAIFTAIETKTATGSASQEQTNYINFVSNNGGYAGIARSAADALKIMKLGLDAPA